jgi:hypothetical protein
MSREKQVKELTKDLCQNGGTCSLEEWNECGLKVGEYCSKCERIADRLISAGYRKQRENTIEFPCKVGDKAWFVFTPRYPANPSDKGKWFMVEDGVQRLIYGAKGVSIETWNMGTISAREIGKKLFFTKEEAEKVLAKMKGANDEN